MNKTPEEILQDEYHKFVIEKGLSSIFPKEFPVQYKEAVLNAMKVDAEQEARSFANWLSNTIIAGRTMDKLWKDYQTAIQ